MGILTPSELSCGNLNVERLVHKNNFSPTWEEKCEIYYPDPETRTR